MIDYRSDTVTKPSKEMLDAMISAPVGDDVFAEDPTINELQEYAANLFGMEAALFCSSGTQTNQIAINVHVAPGGEIICDEESHIYKYEGGGIAKNSGASVRLLKGDRGRLNVEQVSQWFNNKEDIHLPLTQLLSLEDTANRGGGAVYNFEDIVKMRTWCDENNIPMHLDGARLMNALMVNNIDPKTYAAQFHSISLCLSKGLGAPVGSLLIGSKDFIYKSRRVRKVFGGGMRQAGIIAAGGLFALKNNFQRLKQDHDHAKIIQETLENLPWVASVLDAHTNIVVAHLQKPAQRDLIIERMAQEGVKIMAFGPGMLRFVSHLDISPEEIEKTCDILKKLNF